MNLTKREKRMVEICKGPMPIGAAMYDYDKSEWIILTRKLSSLERKPKRVKVVKGWIGLDNSGAHGARIWKRRGDAVSACWDTTCPATLTIELPKPSKAVGKNLYQDGGV